MNYLANLKKISQYFSGNKILSEKIKHIENINQQLEIGKIPQKNFGQIELTDDEIVEILSTITDKDYNHFQKSAEKLQEFDDSLRDYRTYLQNAYGYWAAVTNEFLNKFIETYKHDSYLELMSGIGYISSYLAESNKKVVAVDNQSWKEIDTLETREELFPSLNINVVDAIKKYGNDVSAIILSWAPQDSEIDFEILKAYRNLYHKPKFYLIGEYQGVTYSKKFRNNAKLIEYNAIDKLKNYYNKFDMIDEKIFIID